MDMARAWDLQKSAGSRNESVSIQFVRQVLEKKARRGHEAVMPFNYYWAYDFPTAKPLDWLLKRSFDILASLLTLALLFPFFLLIALAIRLDSSGPVLFSQVRVGHRGKRFHMLKFRSMSQDAEFRQADLLEDNENEVMFKIKDDPRITRIGKFLRKYSLDEFPQLLNVLKGEMSLVGPRPPLPREVSMYQPWHHSRLSTLPGLTGAWQVFGRSNIQNFDQVVSLDFYYLENFSFLNDLRLILRTIPVVISAKGSY